MNVTLYCILSLFVIIVVLIYVIIDHRKNIALLKTVSDTHRGTNSERRLIIRLLKQGIHPITIYHDLYVPIGQNKYAQIDIVILTKVGIIVVEDKDYSGWIFGNGLQHYWTQVLAYGKEKHRFYNPIRQNQGHINALRRVLKDIADVPYYSIITFSGECTLCQINNTPMRTFVTYAINIKSVIDEIIYFYLPAIYTDKHKLISVLKSFVANGDNTSIVSSHIHTVHNSY